MKLGRWLLIVGRIALAAIFLWAGIAKLREPWLQFAISIDEFKVVPESWLEPIARTLPWAEVFLGVALISGFLGRWFSLITAGMLAWFLFIGIRAKVLGLTVDCGCFGAGHGTIDAMWFVEHAAMLLLGGGVMVGEFLQKRAPKPVPEPELTR